MQKQTLCSQKRGVLYPWHGANVVLVAVSDDDSLYLGPPAVQKAGVWKYLLHSQVCEAAQAKNQAVMHHFLMEIKACRTVLSCDVRGPTALLDHFNSLFSAEL